MLSLNVFIFVVGVAVVSCLPTGPYNAQQNQYPAAQPQYGNAVAPNPAYEEPYEERNYKVYYSVKDDPSYNYQTRNEEKNGKVVKGQYTVLEPTGELRIVNYIADENGFRADVQNQAGYSAPIPQPQPRPQAEQPAYAPAPAPYAPAPSRYQSKPY